MKPRTRLLRSLGAALAVAAVVAGCHKEPRCATCGMRIDPASRFTAWLVEPAGQVAFDTPRCALTAWRGAHAAATAARVREYYSQEVRLASTLRFVAQSDVVGPMGPELVPVAPERAAQFAADHHGAPPVTLDELREGALP